MAAGQATMNIRTIPGTIVGSKEVPELASRDEDDFPAKRFHDMEAAFAAGDWRLASEIHQELKTLGVSVWFCGIQVNPKQG